MRQLINYNFDKYNFVQGMGWHHEPFIPSSSLITML